MIAGLSIIIKEKLEKLGFTHSAQKSTPWELERTSISFVCPGTVEPPFNLVVPLSAFITTDVCENVLLQVNINTAAKSKQIIFFIMFVLRNDE
jgi:hypothetical protein